MENLDKLFELIIKIENELEKLDNNELKNEIMRRYLHTSHFSR